jgi:ATP-dependent HslUV protease ATP-binding subunit HslU
VAELDRHIIGQDKAKRAVAVALRNRWRRRQTPLPLRDEIMPFNIILIGPTGVGKTEIARRLASLAQAPFIKVEASRFTEVGYVGRDVESMIRDLADLAVQRERARELERLQAEVAPVVHERLLDLLLPETLRREALASSPGDGQAALEQERHRRLSNLERALDAGELEEEPVTLEVEEGGTLPMMQVFSSSGMEEIATNLQDLIGDLVQRPLREKQLPLRQARTVLGEEEAAARLDMDQLVRRALHRCEQDGIVFIDEIDKICAPMEGSGPDVSRQGVQKDILPVIEGTTVHTKYGLLRTDHMLFIASGAFHVTRPADLIPELQGRFPVRVELESLDRRALERILTEPENSLLRQYRALFAAEGVELELDPSAVREVAALAQEANRRAENIGARRLHGLMHLLLEKELFELPGRSRRKLRVDAARVRERLKDVVEDVDLSRYVL